MRTKGLLAVLALLFAFSSCNDKEVAFEQKTSLIGTWIEIEEDGNPLLTNEREVVTFYENGESIYLRGKEKNIKIQNWFEEKKWRYTLSDNVIRERNDQGEQDSLKILNLTEEKLTVDYHGITCVYQKTKDYTEDIIGLWEGMGVDGEQHRWLFYADSNYNYYTKNEKSLWIESFDYAERYQIKGNWLGTLWKGMGEAPMADWWDIATLNNYRMVLTASRAEGGTQTLALSRVKASESTLRQQILGQWNLEKENGSKCETKGKEFVTFYEDGRSVYIDAMDEKDITPQKWYKTIKCTYTISGNEIREIDEDGNETTMEILAINDIENDMGSQMTKALVLKFNGNVYTYVKFNEDYKQKILGKWKIKYSENAKDHTGNIWKFHANGTFENTTSSTDINQYYALWGNYLGIFWTDNTNKNHCNWFDIFIVDLDMLGEKHTIMAWDLILTQAEDDEYILKKIVE